MSSIKTNRKFKNSMGKKDNANLEKYRYNIRTSVDF